MISEKGLIRSHEFAESVINTVRESLISLDQDLRVVTVSRSFYEFFKVKPEETVGQLIYDLGNKQWEIPKLRELLETILPQKTSFDNYEVEHDFPTIGRRIMLLNARQIKRGMGKERIILLAIEDITERKEAEVELSRYRQRLEKMVEEQTVELKERVKEVSCLYAISSLVAEPYTSIEEALKAAVDFIAPGFQYPDIVCARITFEDKVFATANFRETPWKLSVNIHVPSSEIPARSASLSAAGGRVLRSAIEICYLEERPERDEGPFLKEKLQLINNIARQLGIMIDRRRAEDELRFRNLILSTQQEASIDGILVVDANGMIISSNRRFADMWGIPLDIIGSKSDERALQSVMDLLANPEEFINEVKHLYATPDKKSHDEIALQDGRTFDRYSAPMISAEGRHFGRVWYFRDITERKQAEAEREKLEEQLRQSQKMEAIGTLAGGIAHDFNNILTTIIGNAQLALMDVDKEGPLREEIEEIKKAGERAASLTRQLLAFSRKQIVQPRILNLNEVIADMEKMIGRLIGENVDLLMLQRPELWQVEADPGQIEQIIMNLTVNAKDAMPTGGELTIETANVDLDDSYFRNHGIKEEQPGAYVMLAVSDTGIGMDKETQEHIFDPFFTTKEIGKGTGLGLSTVYGIVKQNKGFIWVYSEPGQGSTFKIYLSRVKGDVASERKEPSLVIGLGGSETILVVEDDESLRKLARTVLEQKGYKVLEAENGEDALRVAEAHDGSIDLMITDVVMPKMGGKEVVKRLQPLYPHMKVIYMSGYTDNAIAHRGILETGLNFIEKPFTPSVLARKVRQALDG